MTHAAQTLDHAIGLSVTSRGQQYFADKFADLLFRNGYQFNQMQVPEWTYSMEEAFNLSKLPASLKKYQAALNEVRDDLSTVFMGFQFNDPKVSVTASNIKYDATFSTFSLKLDRDLTQKYASAPRGAVFVIELDVPAINASIDQVLAIDNNNARFGSFGVKTVTAALAKGSKPIKVQVPVLLQTDKQDGAQIQVLTPVTNIADITLDANLGPLILPKKTGIEINGQMMPVNGPGIERMILRQKTALLKVLQHYLQTYAETSLATTLDDMIKQGVPNGVQETDTLNPPGLDNARESDKYDSVLRLAEVGVKDDQSVYLGLTGVITDPHARSESVLAAGVANPKVPAASSEDQAGYDMALQINQSIMNRMVQLSYERGLFKTVKCESGDVIHITDRPRVIIDGTAGPNRFKLHLAVNQAEGGVINWFFVQDPIVVEFDLIARLEKNGAGDVSAVMESIDEKSIYINPKFIKMDTSLVYGKARDAIRAKNAAFKAKPSNLIDKLPVPPTIFGIPVTVKDYETNPNGYITLFLEYGV